MMIAANNDASYDIHDFLAYLTKYQPKAQTINISKFVGRKVFIKTWDGKFLSAKADKKDLNVTQQARSTDLGLFYVDGFGSKISFKSKHDTFLSCKSDCSIVLKGTCAREEKFFLDVSRNEKYPNSIVIRSCYSSTLFANSNGTFTSKRGVTNDDALICFEIGFKEVKGDVQDQWLDSKEAVDDDDVLDKKEEPFVNKPELVVTKFGGFLTKALKRKPSSRFEQKQKPGVKGSVASVLIMSQLDRLSSSLIASKDKVQTKVAGMYVCMYVMCVCTCVCMYVCVYVCICVYIYIYIYVCMCVCVCVRVCVPVCVCVCICKIRE